MRFCYLTAIVRILRIRFPQPILHPHISLLHNHNVTSRGPLRTPFPLISNFLKFNVGDLLLYFTDLHFVPMNKDVDVSQVVLMSVTPYFHMHRLTYSNMSSFLAYCIIFAMFLFCKTEAIESNQDVLRFSSGLKFSWFKEYSPATRVWFHSYVTNLPIQFIMKSHTDMLVNSNLTVTKTQWLHNCLLQHNFDLHSQGPKVLHPETSPQTYCIKFADYIKNLIQTVKRNHDLISEYSELINHLLPPDIEPHLTSKRRGILDFGGSLLSGLFGVATKADLEKLAGQLQAIGVALRKGGDTHKQSMDSMASFSTIINTRMANLVDTVKQTALNTAATFNSFAEDMFSELGFMVEMQKKLVTHESSVKAVLTHLQLFYNAMTQLTTGTLPNFLITPQMLQTSINDITAIANSYDPPLRLIFNEPLQYYRRCVYTYAIVNQHLVISIAFYMTHFDPPFDVYKIFYYPLLVPGQPNSTMQLKYQESGVAFQRNLEHFFFLSSDDILELQITNTLDRLFRTVKLMTNDTCIVALFHNHKQLIKEHCQYTITVNTVQPSFLWLNQNHFLLTGSYQYQLRCASGKKQTQPGCQTQCILKPANECQIITATAISVPLISNASALPVVHRYVVNYPYLHHFFQQEEIQALEERNFLETPPTFHLPPLKLFINPIKALVAEEIKSELEMRNVVESIKSESLLINSLEDGILFTSQSSSKIFGDSLE